MSCRGWAVGALVLSLGPAGLGAVRQGPVAPRTIIERGMVWPGNTLRVGSRGRLLMVAEELVGGRYQIWTYQSLDDGKSWSRWRRVSVGVRDNTYDATMVALGSRSLLVGFHGSGRLWFYQSDNAGLSWRRVSQIAPGPDEGLAEVFLRPLTDSLAGKKLLLLAYARVQVPRATATYEVRVSQDGGTSWGEAVLVGNGGRITDGVRAGVGVPGAPAGIPVVFAYRRAPDDSVEIRLARVALNPLRVSVPESTLAITAPVGSNVGVFPTVVRCDASETIVYTLWFPRDSSRIAVLELGRGAVSPSLVPRSLLGSPSSLAGNGFGRVWLTPSWDGEPRMIYVESPDQSRTVVRYVPAPRFRGCRF